MSETTYYQSNRLKEKKTKRISKKTKKHISQMHICQ